MNIEKMLAGLTPEKLEAGLSKLSGVLSEEQTKQIRRVLSNPDKEELSKQLKDVDIDKVRESDQFKSIFPNK